MMLIDKGCPEVVEMTSERSSIVFVLISSPLLSDNSATIREGFRLGTKIVALIAESPWILEFFSLILILYILGDYLLRIGVFVSSVFCLYYSSYYNLRILPLFRSLRTLASTLACRSSI